MGLEYTPLESVFRRNHFKKYPPKYPPLYSIKIDDCYVGLELTQNVYSRVFTDRRLAFTRVEFR